MFKSDVDNVGNFIKEQQKLRKQRQLDKTNHDAAIIIQKHFRRFITQNRIRRKLREQFQSAVCSEDNSLDIDVVFDQINLLKFLYKNDMSDIEIFFKVCQTFSDSMLATSKRGYDSFLLHKDTAKKWISNTKWFVKNILRALEKLDEHTDQFFKKVPFLIKFLLQLTTPIYWSHIQSSKFAERYNKIANIFVDFAHANNLYPVSKIIFHHFIMSNTDPGIEISLNNLFNVCLKPLLTEAGFTDKGRLLDFLRNILTMPGLVMFIGTLNIDTIKRHLIMTQVTVHISENLDLLNVRGNECLYIIGNMVHLSLNEIEILVEKSMLFCKVISEMLRILGKYVSERKKSNLTTWHPILGWFEQTDEQYPSQAMSNVLKQLRLLWHNKMVLLLFSNFYEEDELDTENNNLRGTLSGLDTPLPSYVKFENLPTFSRLKKDSSSIVTSFFQQISHRLTTQSSQEHNKIRPRDLPVNLKTVCMMYCFAISSLSEIRNDLLNGLSLGDLLLRMWKLIYACGSVDQWANSIYECNDKWFYEPHECHFYFLYTSASSNLLIILDDTELFEKQKSFSIDQLREMSLLFNHIFYRTSLIIPRPEELKIKSNNFMIFSTLTLDPNDKERKEASSKSVAKCPSSYSLNLLLSSTLTILQILYARDTRRDFTDSPNFWLIKDVKSLAFMSDLRKDQPHAKFLLKHVPQILPHRERILLFREYVKADKVSVGRKVTSSFLQEDGPYGTMISVNRSRIVEDGYQQLRTLSPLQLKLKIRVQFTNKMGLDEVGIDLDGVFKEFLEETLRKVFDPSLSLFKTTTDNRLYPSPTSHLQHGHLKLFEFFGKVLGKAIYEGITIDVPLANFFLTQMLHKEKTGCYSFLDELATLDKDLYKSLTYIKHYDGDVSDLSLTFSYDEDLLGTVVVHDLVPGGRYLTVTNELKINYVHRLAQFRMYKQIRAQTIHFMKGFYSIIKPEWLSIFSSPELQKLISGDSVSIDIEDLKNNTKYMGGFHANHRVIIWLWDILKKDLNEKERGLFLKFVTSCSKPPLLGFSNLEPQFCIRCVQYSNEDSDTGDSVGSIIRGFLHIPSLGSSRLAGNSRSSKIINSDTQMRLPTASTCFNLLKLPNYTSKQLLREKLKYAINSNSGFELS